eukprot:730728-Rhodomonas_salina.1
MGTRKERGGEEGERRRRREETNVVKGGRDREVTRGAVVHQLDVRLVSVFPHHPRVPATRFR